MGQLLLIGSQIVYRIFEYQRKKLVQKLRDLLGGGWGSSRDPFGSQGKGGSIGDQKRIV